jgi:hypothetical protein
MLPTTNAVGVQNTGDIGGSQDVALPASPCGCVYYLNVDATLTATDMASMVCGTSQAADANGNTCSTAGIASPDNVASIDDFDTLIIGEDTGSHRVDFLWQARARRGEGCMAAAAAAAIDLPCLAPHTRHSHTTDVRC